MLGLELFTTVTVLSHCLRGARIGAQVRRTSPLSRSLALSLLPSDQPFHNLPDALCHPRSAKYMALRTHALARCLFESSDYWHVLRLLRFVVLRVVRNSTSESGLSMATSCLSNSPFASAVHGRCVRMAQHKWSTS